MPTEGEAKQPADGTNEGWIDPPKKPGGSATTSLLERDPGPGMVHEPRPGESVLRRVNGSPYVSDNANYILDCHFDAILDPRQTELMINNTPGVVENGLFVNRVDRVIIGTPSGTRMKERES